MRWSMSCPRKRWPTAKAAASIGKASIALRGVGSLNKLANVLKAQVKAGRVKKLNRGLYEVTWYDPPRPRAKRES